LSKKIKVFFGNKAISCPKQNSYAVSKPLLETSNFFGQPRAPREESELSENLFEQFGKGMIVNTPFARESV